MEQGFPLMKANSGGRWLFIIENINALDKILHFSIKRKGKMVRFLEKRRKRRVFLCLTIYTKTFLDRVNWRTCGWKLKKSKKGAICGKDSVRRFIMFLAFLGSEMSKFEIQNDWLIKTMRKIKFCIIFCLKNDTSKIWLNFRRNISVHKV